MSMSDVNCSLLAELLVLYKYTNISILYSIFYSTLFNLFFPLTLTVTVTVTLTVTLTHQKNRTVMLLVKVMASVVVKEGVNQIGTK